MQKNINIKLGWTFLQIFLMLNSHHIEWKTKSTEFKNNQKFYQLSIYQIKLIGPEPPLVQFKIKVNADHVGYFQELVPLKHCMNLKDMHSLNYQNNKLLIVILLHKVAMVEIHQTFMNMFNNMVLKLKTIIHTVVKIKVVNMMPVK